MTDEQKEQLEKFIAENPNKDVFVEIHKHDKNAPIKPIHVAARTWSAFDPEDGVEFMIGEDGDVYRDKRPPYDKSGDVS